MAGLATRQTFGKEITWFSGGGLVLTSVCACEWMGVGGRRENQFINHILQIFPSWVGCKLTALLSSSSDWCIGTMGFVSLLLAISLDLAGRSIKMFSDLHALGWLSCILYRTIFRWIVSVGLCPFVFWGSEVTSKTSLPAAWCDLWTPKGTRSWGHKIRHKH